MAELSFQTKRGTLWVQGWQQETMKRAAELGQLIVETGDSTGEFLDFEGSRVYVKGSHLRGKARTRHALKRLFLKRRTPRIEEYFNLCWLTERHFQTPLPLAAGEFLSGGTAHYHYLITRAEPDVSTLDAWCTGAPADERRSVLHELAREVARMHSLLFLHHDLHPRNLLVGSPERARRVLFLDAWAGGSTLIRRPFEYDLACLLLDADSYLDREDQRGFLETYLAQRQVQDRAVDARTFLARVGRERRALFAQLERDPRRLRGRALPRADWDPAQLGVDTAR